jgi:glycosyltransferase involved in cell wall biosynthesis
LWIGFFKAMTPSSIRIAVLVPCFNEEAAVATVVADFRKALPSAEIFVYDNNSTDRTIAVARGAGAQVRSERRQGKGHVVRRMFADIDADVYVLVDGDATYDAASAPRMVDALLSERLDMVRRPGGGRLSARPSHRQPDADRLSLLGIRPGLQGYSFRLSGILAPLRQVLSGALGWLRD